MPQTVTDLTRLSDAELDASLTILFRQHHAATKAKDTQAIAECKEATRLILAEQGRRLDGWLDHTLGVE